MLNIFLGADEFSKRQEIDSLVKEKGADLVMFGQDDNVSLAKLTETDLFSRPKVFVLGDVSLVVENTEKLILLPNQIVVCTESLDKRKKENKELLANPRIAIKEFVLPHGQELDQWIINRAAHLGAKMSVEAARELAVRVGRDQARETRVGGKVVEIKEIYNLFQVNAEIQKLASLVNGREILTEDVKSLVSENYEVDAFSITNAIAEKNRELSLRLISQFLSQQNSADEKTGIIQLNALLSEQFRNVVLVQNLLENKVSDQKILENSGWKPGRLFVIKKIASRFKSQMVLDLLNKFEHLDEELKSSQTPPRVLLDLILSQLMF